MADLINRARLDGDYNDETPMWLETTLTIQTVDITIVKTADHTIWGDGDLTYIITMTNSDTNPLTNPVLTDTLDISAVVFVEDSVTVNGTETTDYVYDAASGVLRVNLPTLTAGSSLVVTFRVTKA